MKSSRIETVEIGKKTYRVRHWGADNARIIFMLHGWMDCSATFQFVIDAFRQGWHVIAPDWRGHGGSHRTDETYIFLQLVADLDALLERYSPDAPVQIVGHSLGANVASVYAGTRPHRISRFVNLEGLAPIPGLSPGSPTERIERWLARLRKGVANRVYASYEELARRLRQMNPRLTAVRADILAREFSRARPEGGFEFDVDPYQHAPPPLIGHHEIVRSAWRQISAPVLLITAADSHIMAAFASAPGLFEERLALLRHVEHVQLADAAHNLHHDQPEEVAALIERFLR